MTHPPTFKIPGSDQNDHSAPGLQATLQRIVDDVTSGLGCVGATVATLETNNILPVQAYSVSIAPNLLNRLEKMLDLSFIGPKSVINLDDKKFKDNLSYRAVKGHKGQPEKYVISDSLYDLLRPAASRALSDTAQQLTGVKQLIAVPFFLGDEVVGNLLAATCTEFSARDIDFLIAYGHQAAIALQSQRRLAEAQALESIIFDLQASLTDENQAFKIITDAVVDKLGYLAALVAPRIGNSLPVRAYTVNSNLISQDFIETWQRRTGFELIGEKSVAYLDRSDYAVQLSVRAIKSGQAQMSDSLYDLVRPVLPKFPVDTIQKLLGIKQVIAIPFFMHDEAIGNLYVVSIRPRFSTREQQILQAFGQHAAVSIRNAQLYRKAEDRWQQLQTFAKMAFSAAASVHALRNHLGAFRMYYQMMKPQLNEGFQKLGDDVVSRLNQAADTLEKLHEPWREQPDSQTEVNRCLHRALDKIIPDREALNLREGIMVHLSLAENLPPVYTSPDMLTEAFGMVLKNSIEALRERMRYHKAGGELWVESDLKPDSTVEVTIRDSGLGLKPEVLGKIFEEMKWPTQEAGLGFGLFWTKDYIEGLGGSLKIESIWQEGTRFKLNLPVFLK